MERYKDTFLLYKYDGDVYLIRRQPGDLNKNEGLCEEGAAGALRPAAVCTPALLRSDSRRWA